jgi:SPP1 family predicted phage head-tail adaptor
MRAGELDRRITIQSQTTTQADNLELNTAWVDEVSLPAAVKGLRGSERFEHDQRTAEQTKVFKIRYRKALTTKHRIVYDGQSYDIVNINELGRRAGLELTAVAVLDE